MKKNLLLLSFLLFSLPKLWAETVIICAGETYSWHGMTCTVSGVYTYGADTYGADTLYLTVLPENPIIHEYATICSGEVYEWYDAIYWESGEYSIILYDNFGCEQITILHLTVNQCEEGQVDYVTICAGETYSWHGTTYTASGVYTYGADTLYLTVLPKAIVEEDSITIHEKDLPYTWHNQKIDTSGVYTDTILYSQTECDSAIYILNVEVEGLVENAIICSGETYSWHDATYTTSGVYTYGADTLYLTALPKATVEKKNITIDEKVLPYTWHNQMITCSGVYTDTIPYSQAECDSAIYILNVKVEYNEVICSGETYLWHGTTYTASGVYTYGADILYLTVLPEAIVVEDSITIHEKDLPYTWHNQKIDTSGVYTDTILYNSQTECDSAIYVLNVEVIPDNTCGPILIWVYIPPCTLVITGRGDMYDYFTEIVPWKDLVNNIHTIVLPEELSSIGAFAFADCYYLSSFDVPSSVVRINDGAFENCRSLSSVNFANNSQLTTIGSWAFYNCHELKNIVIPEGVTEIGHAAFYGCTYLKDLTLPASLQSIADNGFAGCSKLAQIQVNAIIPPQVDARTFEDVDRSIPVIVPDESVEQYKSAPVWREFNIRGKIGTGVENITSTTNNIQKIIRDGQLVIVRDGKIYSIMGQEL